MKREREGEKSVSIDDPEQRDPGWMWMLSLVPSIKSDKLLGELGRARYNTVAEIRLLSGTATGANRRSGAPPRFVDTLRVRLLSLPLSPSPSIYLFDFPSTMDGLATRSRLLRSNVQLGRKEKK